jgi:glycerol-3-phosphate dehydrogenase (NAD(P)+)
MKKISVIGSGSWGTALAVMLDKYGHDVTIWCRRESAANAIIEDGENKEYLPGIEVRKSITVTTDIEKAIGSADIIINAIPSKSVRASMEKFAHLFNENQVIINVSKGLEESTLMRISQVIKDCVPQCEVCTMVGPTHAEEVGKGIPSVCVIACENPDTAKMLQEELNNATFRLYTNDDMVGTEMGAALKNIIALAAGMSDGLGFGDNTKAALITRGLAEICRLGIAMGGKLETFMGLSVRTIVVGAVILNLSISARM